jgi:hypothetical protein
MTQWYDPSIATLHDVAAGAVRHDACDNRGIFKKNNRPDVTRDEKKRGNFDYISPFLDQGFHSRGESCL